MAFIISAITELLLTKSYNFSSKGAIVQKRELNLVQAECHERVGKNGDGFQVEL